MKLIPRVVAVATMPMLILLGGSAGAAVTAAFSLGSSCGGATSSPFTAGGAPITVSLCASTTTEQVCNSTLQPIAANAGESGRFNITNRVVPATGLTDPTNAAPPYPVPINNPVNSTDFGSSVPVTPVAAGSNILLATFTIAPQATATNASYTIGMGGLSAIGVPSTPGDCGTSQDVSLNGLATFTFIQQLTPPTIAKLFGASSVALNGNTSLSFTINNPNANTGLTGVAFTDTLPAGLVVTSPNGLSGSCGAGTITAVAGSGTVSLSGGTIAGGGSCTFSVNVTGTAAGAKANSVTVTSTEGGTGNTSTANLAVVAPPSISKQFTPASIPLNGTSALSFTITNPAANTVSLTGVGFTDTLPAGLVVSTPNGVTGTCGGGTITAVAASSSVSLSGATLATNSSCTFSVNVTGTTTGAKANTSAAVTSTNGGTGNTASATLNVVNTITATKTFGAPTIPLNTSTSMSFTLTNPNAAAGLTGVSFTDTLPAGLVVSTPNGLSGSCGSGTITATAGSGTVSLTGGTIAASGNCTFSVNVTGTTAGVKNNSITPSSTETGAGPAANATVTVVAPATISKSFGVSTMTPGGTTTLTFVLNNPNAGTTLTGVGFTDPLPAGLVVSTPNGLAGTCGGGTITATAGANIISLTGASLAANASCTFTVNVTGTGNGQLNNTTTAVTSANGGNGGTASATIFVGVSTPPAGIPTLSGWMLGLLGLLLSITGGWVTLRRGNNARS